MKNLLSFFVILSLFLSCSSSKVGSIGKSPLVGIWQLIDSKLVGSSIVERNTVMFKVFNSDGSCYVFAPVSQLQTIVIAQHGCFSLGKDNTFTETITERAFNSLYNGKSVEVSYFFEDYNTLFTCYKNPISGQLEKEQWHRIIFSSKGLSSLPNGSSF